MAITNATTVPILIAARLLDAYRRRRVFADRVSRTYEGLLRDSAGDRVRLNVASTQSVADYVAGTTTIAYADADVGTPVDLVMDKSKYWAVSIGDIAEVQSVPAILDASVGEAGNALAEQVDLDIYADMFTNATAGPAVALNHSANNATTLAALPFAQMHRALDVANVPREGRYLIIGPYGAEIIQKTAVGNETIVGFNAQTNLINGTLGSFAGFDIAVANIGGANAAGNNTLASGTATETWVFGVPGAVEMAEQVRRVEQMRLQGSFSDAVRGLLTYGSKVVKATGLYKSTATITNVP